MMIASSMELFFPKVKNRATDSLLTACFVMLKNWDRFAYIYLRLNGCNAAVTI